YIEVKNRPKYIIKKSHRGNP
ncbi:hypothetical protein ACNC4L_004024, partial [Escherichia coli]